MHDNYYVLKELSVYLDNVLSGAEIIECFSQEKNHLIIHFVKSHKEIFLEFSSGKDFPYLILRENYTKAKKNVAIIFKILSGRKVKKIFIKNDDRLINFELSDSSEFIFSFIKGRLNIILVLNDIITDSFKESSSLINNNIKNYFSSKPAKIYDVKNIKDYFKSGYIRFGKLYWEEILFNLRLNYNDIINEGTKKKIDFEFEILKTSFKNPDYLLYTNKENIFLSLIKLNSIPDDYTTTKFSNINELLSFYIHKIQKNISISEIKEKKISSISSEISKNEKKFQNLKHSYVEASESSRYLDIGNHILSNLYNIIEGDDKFEIILDEKIESIKLNRNLTPSENAQKYFQKYKKQKSSLDILKRKMEKLEMKLKYLKQQLDDTMKLTDIKKLKSTDKSSKKINMNDETNKFRKFVLNSDFQVWVGKDSKSNDLLTMKYSSPNDLWFHIRGTSGSHTVLKTGNKNEQIDKKIIEAAASICAYYSKARNAGTVPVAYCLRKYVKKKKGFNEGSVIMEKEKVIFIKPGLPEDISEN